MASLPVPDEAVYLHESVVQGHHVYKRVWSPVVGEILQLSCEEDNDHDRFSVSVMKAEFVVGHAPRRLSCTVWHFLRHCGKATCEVTGRRKFGNGLEVPCLYSISSLACSSFALPCQNARRRGYSVGEVGVNPELLPSRESDRSMQNGEAKGELRSHSSHVHVFNTCNTRMRLLRMT